MLDKPTIGGQPEIGSMDMGVFRIPKPSVEPSAFRIPDATSASPMADAFRIPESNPMEPSFRIPGTETTAQTSVQQQPSPGGFGGFLGNSLDALKVGLTQYGSSKLAGISAIPGVRDEWLMGMAESIQGAVDDDTIREVNMRTGGQLDATSVMGIIKEFPRMGWYGLLQNAPQLVDAMVSSVIGKAIGTPLGAALGLPAGLPGVAAAGGTGGVAGAYVAGTASAGLTEAGSFKLAALPALKAQGFDDATANMLADKYAGMYGIPAGIIEYASNIFQLGRVGKAGKAVAGKALTQALKKTPLWKMAFLPVTGGMSEGGEELSQGWLSRKITKMMWDEAEQMAGRELQRPDEENLVKQTAAGAAVGTLMGAMGLPGSVQQARLSNQQAQTQAREAALVQSQPPPVVSEQAQPQAPIEQTEQRGAAAPLPTAPPVASPKAAVPPAPIRLPSQRRTTRAADLEARLAGTPVGRTGSTLARLSAQTGIPENDIARMPRVDQERMLNDTEYAQAKSAAWLASKGADKQARPAAQKIQQEPAQAALAPPQARPGPEAVGTTQQGGQVPPAAIEQLTLPGRAGISEEQKPPELMTPEERKALIAELDALDARWKEHDPYDVSPERAREALGDEVADRRDALGKALAFTKQSGKQIIESYDAYHRKLKEIYDKDWHGVGLSHVFHLNNAISENRPVSSAAVEAYGIKLPEGYVKDGDRYVFRGTQPQEGAQNAVQEGQVGQEQGQVQKPVGETVQPQTGEVVLRNGRVQEEGKKEEEVGKESVKREQVEMQKYVAAMVPSAANYIRRSIESGMSPKDAALAWAREIGMGLADNSDEAYRKERGGLYTSSYIKGQFASGTIEVNAKEFLKAVDQARQEGMAEKERTFARQRAIMAAPRPQPSLPAAAPMSRQQVVMDAKRRATQAGGAFVQRQVYGDEVGVISIGPATIRVVHAPPPSPKIGTAAGAIAREGRYQYTMYVDPETGQSTTVSHELGHVTRDILHVNERAMIKMVYGWDLDTRQGDETFAGKFETEEGRKELAAGLRRATVGQQNVVLRAINRVIGFMNAVFKTKIARIGTAGDLDRLAGTLEGFGALRELAGKGRWTLDDMARGQRTQAKGDSPIERMNLSVMSLGERLWRNIADIGVRTNLYAKHLVGGKEWQETYRMVQGMIGEKGKNALSTARGIADSVVRAGLTEKELNDYLDATHSKDRNEMFRKRGEAATASMTDDEADKTLKALAAKEAKLRPIAEMVWKLNAATRRAMVDYGLVEQSVVDKWVAEFGEHYVPLRSEDVEGDMARYDPTMRAGIQGLEAMEAHGRGSRAFSPLAWSVAQAMHTISRGEHNIVAQELAKLVQANPMAKVWSVEAIPGMAEIKEAAEIRKEAKQELAKARDDMLKAKGAMDEAMSMAGRGMVVASTLKQAKANLAAARERHEALKEQLKAIEDSSPESVRASQPAPGYAVALTYKDGGQQMRINMNDPWLYRALTFSSPPIANKALHGVVTATKMYGRLLTEYNPEWWLVNLVKDLQTAGFNLTAGKGKGLAVKTYRHFNGARRAILAGELGKTVKNAEWAKYLALYNKGGGPISVIGALRAGDIEEEILRLTKGGGIGKGNMGRILAKTGQWMDAQQRSIELGTRLAVFRSMMESGFSEKESILGSKNATVNFEMKGELSNRIGGLYLFFNASLQGPIAMGKALVGPNGIKMMAGTILLGYVMDQINRAVSPDDDDDGENDYDRIPDWQKDNNIFIGNKVRIPLGYGLSFFYALGRNLSSADSGTASMEKATANMLNSFLTSFNPLGGKGTLLQNIAPTMAAPAVQVYENKDFMGRPIYPTPYGIKKPSDVSWRDTPESAKALSKIVSRITGGDTVQRGLVEIPPNIWDHILRFFTPGPASTAKRAFDTARKLQSGKTMEAKDIPGVRRFAYAASDKQAFQRFYEINNIARDAERKYKAYLAAGERENAKKWREGHIAELRIKAQADAAREKINKARGNASKAKGYLRDTWEDKAVKEARRVIKSYATMKEKEKAGR